MVKMEHQVQKVIKDQEEVNKKCTKCHNIKNITFFTKDSSKKDGLRSSCRDCDKIIKKLYYLNNKEKVKISNKNWENKNPEKIKEIKNKYRISIKHKEWKERNKTRISELKKNWNIKNPEKVKQCKRKERIKNSERYKKYYKNYKKQRELNDILFLLKERIGCLIRNSTKKYYKNSRAVNILKIEISKFRDYIESQFLENMSWENYGEWELDHKVPVSLAENQDEFLKLNHYSNFRPLWKKENISKSNKLLKEFENLYVELLNN